MIYFLVKWIHILSATLVFGTGLGSAFYMFMANRRKELGGIVFASRHVVIADTLFTAPAILLQIASGLYLAHLSNLDVMSGWLGWAIGLYVFSLLCWFPVLVLQIRMRDMAHEAVRTGTALPARYWHYDRWWIVLGSLAFPAFLAIFYLMIAKPF